MHDPNEQTQSAQLRRAAEEVKVLSDDARKADGRTGIRRHFEGYELGLLSVGIALAFSALALPRASEPLELPLPVVDRQQLRLREQADRQAAARARREGLSFDVRAVGEGIRGLGRALTSGDDTSHYAADVRARARLVLDKDGPEPLLRLRAVQSELFLAALYAYEQRRADSSDLRELGGDFMRHAQSAGWFDASGRCLLDESERRVVFALRWADLIGQRETLPFSPTLDEWRVYYRFYLLHPEAHAGALAPSSVGYASALFSKDASYPVDFARGVLAYRAGNLTAAASSFRHHLATHVGGPYALLARNYLIYTLEQGGLE